VVRWRIINLAQWLWDDFAVSISKQALRHELHAMGYRKLSARPRHRGQRPDDIAVLKRVRCPSGANQAAAPKRHGGRAVVAGRGPHRPADQAHQTRGEARHPPFCSEEPAPFLGLDLRGHLPR
jgi:hypothetical protein